MRPAIRHFIAGSSYDLYEDQYICYIKNIYYVIRVEQSETIKYSTDATSR